MEYNNFHIDTIRWQMSKSTKRLPQIFSFALTIPEMKFFWIFYLKKVCQGHRIYNFHIYANSMANVKIDKHHFLHL